MVPEPLGDIGFVEIIVFGSFFLVPFLIAMKIASSLFTDPKEKPRRNNSGIDDDLDDIAAVYFSRGL